MLLPLFCFSKKNEVTETLLNYEVGKRLVQMKETSAVRAQANKPTQGQMPTKYNVSGQFL